MSQKVFQNLINQTKDVLDQEIGIMDESGMVLACSNEWRNGQKHPLLPMFNQSRDKCFVAEGYAFERIYNRGKLEFITFISSVDKYSQKLLSLFSINLVNIKAHYDEKFDKANYIKSMILNNNINGDALLRAKELHLEYTVPRIIYLIRTVKVRDTFVFDIIQRMFPNKAKDTVIMIDDENIVLVREVKENEDNREIEKTARTIVDTINSELMIKATVGVGTVAGSISELNRSFKEARVALRIGKIFGSDRPVVFYNNLGLWRLICQVPKGFCEMFLKEVFKDYDFDAIDAETMHTIQKFFENNLNVSETSRQLYVHRNTLVYRLDKIQKMTGLDIRNFDDAIIFKVAIMVRKYLDASENGA